MRGPLRKPSPAMVVAVAALIAALGGEAIAGEVASLARKLTSKDLAKGSVTSSKVRDRSLLLKDFKGSERAKLKGDTGLPGGQGPQGLQGLQGPPGTVDTSNFFTKDESDRRYMFGDGSMLVNQRVLTSGGPTLNFIGVPELGRVEITCNDPTSSRATFRNTAGTDVQLWESFDGGAATFYELNNNDTRTANSAPGVDDPARVEWEAGLGTPSTGGLRMARIVVDILNAPSASQTECHFRAMLIYSETVEN